MLRVARARYGEENAEAVVDAWVMCSEAFSEFPYDGGVVYRAPMQFGPSNLLWAEPTGYASTMIGFPYDDLNGWRGPYPPEVFIQQMVKVADGFGAGYRSLRDHTGADPDAALQGERDIVKSWG
jgi:hypothetical protein